jgi:hypothetical protein
MSIPLSTSSVENDPACLREILPPPRVSDGVGAGDASSIWCRGELPTEVFVLVTDGGEWDSPRSGIGEIGVRPENEFDCTILVPPIMNARAGNAASEDKSVLISSSRGAIAVHEQATSAIEP